MAVRRFGAAGDRLVLEAFLPGPEASAFALCDGDRFRVWPLARDHKQLLDGGVGPNTGGMGAITPPPGLGEEARQIVAERVFGPILGAMARRGTPFAGILFAGLKWAADGPSVLEFNVRLGDPETQALVMTMRGSLATALLAAARGTLDERALGFEGAGASVVAAARGYPLRPELGAVIDVGDMGLAPNAAGWAQVFHAGTALGPGGLVVAGGRVLSVAASGATIAEARARAYQRLAHIRFDGMHARRDVGLG
jgi:phosphoribosylamine--glycine ligase